MNESDSTEDLLHLDATYETTVFVNQSGSLSILQQDPSNNESPVVVLTKDQAAHVYLALKAFAES